MTAAALPIVGLMLEAQSVQRSVQWMHFGARQGWWEILPHDAAEMESDMQCAAIDEMRAERGLRLTVAANDEAPASPVQA